MADAQATIVLTLDLSADPIGGYLVANRGRARSFHGWLDLAERIEAARRDALDASSRSADPQARDDS